MTLQFVKMHGTGNDFVIIDQRATGYIPVNAEKIARRKFGVGCDQLVILAPSEKCACKMLIFNNDGTSSVTCGNAARCIAALIMDKNESETSIELINEQILHCIKINDSIFVNMGKPSFNSKDINSEQGKNIEDLLRKDLPDYITLNPVTVSMGNPHLVLFTDICKREYIEESGSIFEKHPVFPNGVNVEIAAIASKEIINLKIWERGVGLTESCGSGACAAFAAAYKLGLVSDQVRINVPGGLLEVKKSDNGTLLLTGAIEYVFKGELLLSDI